MRRQLELAAFLDKWESRIRRVGERIGWPQAWLQEFIAYRNEPRMSLEEFWCRYTLLRLATTPRFAAVKTKEDAEAFYTECDYMLWRNLVHRRHSAWRRVLRTMPKATGRLVEYGCGIAPISAYVSRYRRAWDYVLVDLPSAHRDYAAWRVASQGYVDVRDEMPRYANADVITLIDVLEHLPDPLKTTKRCVEALRRGGYLHVNFVGNPQMNDLDLASPEQRDDTLAYLAGTLERVWEKDGYQVLRKR